MINTAVDLDLGAIDLQRSVERGVLKMNYSIGHAVTDDTLARMALTVLDGLTTAAPFNRADAINYAMDSLRNIREGSRRQHLRGL